MILRILILRVNIFKLPGLKINENNIFICNYYLEKKRISKK